MHLGIRLVWPALLALQTFALGAAPAFVRHQGLLRPGLSHRDGVAGRGRGQEGLLCRQRRRDGHRVDRRLAGHAGGGVGLAQYHAQHLQRGDQLHRVRAAGNPSVAGLHGHSSRRRGRQEGSQERERAQGQGGRHLVDQVGLDHSAAPAAESARARAVRLRRGGGAGQRADFQRAAGGRARRGLAGAAAIADRHDRRLSGDRHASARWRRNSRSSASPPTMPG